MSSRWATSSRKYGQSSTRSSGVSWPRRPARPPWLLNTTRLRSLGTKSSRAPTCCSARRYGRIGSSHDLVLEEHEHLIAELLDERAEARAVPTARDETEPVGLDRTAFPDDVDETRVGGDPVATDVVLHRRLRVVDRVAQDRDQLHVGMQRLHAFGDAIGVVPPDHVAGRGFTDDRLALPAFELFAVPVDALVRHAFAVVPEVHLGIVGEDVGVRAHVDAQPSCCRLLRSDDDERRERAARTRIGNRLGRQVRNPSEQGRRKQAGYPPTLGRSRRTQHPRHRFSSACAANSARSAS